MKKIEKVNWCGLEIHVTYWDNMKENGNGKGGMVYGCCWSVVLCEGRGE